MSCPAARSLRSARNTSEGNRDFGKGIQNRLVHLIRILDATNYVLRRIILLGQLCRINPLRLLMEGIIVIPLRTMFSRVKFMNEIVHPSRTA